MLALSFFFISIPKQRFSFSKLKMTSQPITPIVFLRSRFCLNMDIFGKLLSKCGFKVFTFNRFKLFDGFDYRRSILKAKCRVGMRPLSSSFENRVGGRKVITIHFRTPRWHKLMHTTQSEFDYLRDCDPVQYFDAIRYLLDLGYFVVVCSDGFKSGLASEGSSRT